MMSESDGVRDDMPDTTFQIVRRCARTCLNDRDRAYLAAHLHESFDWKELVYLTSLHGIQPVVFRNLVGSGSAHLTGKVDHFLRQSIFRSQASSTFFAQELGRLQSRFERAGIEVLTLKGPAMARLVYGDIGLRTTTDLDVLIRPEDFSRLEAVVREDGYIPFSTVAQLQGLRKRYKIWQTQQYPFKRGGGTFNLDVHVGIMPPLYHFPVSFESLWERSVPCEIGGSVVRTLGYEDLLLMLSFHGEKNRWERLKYVCDIAQIIQAIPGLDWNAVLERAHQWRCERKLFIGLLMASDLLGARLPVEVEQRARRDDAIGRMAEEIVRRMASGRIGILSFGERVRFHLALQDTFRTKLRYLCIALLRRALPIRE